MFKLLLSSNDESPMNSRRVVKSKCCSFEQYLNALLPIFNNLESGGNNICSRFVSCLNDPSQISSKHDGNLTSSSLEQFAKACFSIIITFVLSRSKYFYTGIYLELESKKGNKNT